MAAVYPHEKDPLIALDDGHGMHTSGKRTPTLPAGVVSETGNFMHENEFNRAVVKYLVQELKRCGFRTLEVAPGDDDVPLSTRVNKANAAGAHFYLSVHANAIKGAFGEWGGIETFTHYSYANSTAAGKILHKHLLGGTKLRDRGLKNGDWLYVVRKTNMAAVLVECGFMDNLYEAKLLLSDAYRRECARELAQGLCEIYGKTYVPASNPTPPKKIPSATGKGIGEAEVLTAHLNVRASADFNSKIVSVLDRHDSEDVYEEKNGLYRIDGGWISAGKEYVKFTKHVAPKKDGLHKVQVGAFGIKSNAEKLSAELASKGFKNFVTKEGNLYKVQTGAFGEKANAEALASQLHKHGYKTFIVFE
jgi:N-acetylmuramoyl-L-alanine amidase